MFEKLGSLEYVLGQLISSFPQFRPLWAQGGPVTPWSSWFEPGEFPKDYWLECPTAIHKMMTKYEETPNEKLKTDILFSIRQLDRFVTAWLEEITNLLT